MSRKPIGMRSFLMGLGTMLASLTVGSLLAFNSVAFSSQLPLQLGLLKLLHNVYSFLLTPLSSALGAPSLGGQINVGIWPLIIWIFSSIFIGLLTGEPVRAGKIVFTSASIVFTFWIFSNFMLYSLWNDNLRWLSEVDRLMSDLFLYRALDIVFFLTVPSIISATSAFIILYLITTRDRSSNLQDEEYPTM